MPGWSAKRRKRYSRVEPPVNDDTGVERSLRGKDRKPAESPAWWGSRKMSL